MELLKKVLNYTNLASAQRKVMSNKGAAGVDGMQVNELTEYMKHHRKQLVEAIESGWYQPQASNSVNS